MSEPTKQEWRKMPRAEKNVWLRRALAKIRNAVHGRPVCWRCWIPFSDWFVWNGWNYCYLCHSETKQPGWDGVGLVILEPAANREPFYA